MKKFLLTTALVLLAGVTMAQTPIEFTFTRNGNGATVAVNGAEGVTATIAATSASNAWNTGGAMASRTDVLCQNTNTSATSEGSPITYTLTIEGLTATVASVAFTHIAVNSGGNLQPSNNSDVRHCNFKLEVNGEAKGELTDQNIWIPAGSTDKTISFDNLEIAADGTLTLKLTLYKGTSNNGCFYGLTKITLAQPLSEDDVVESGQTFTWATNTTWNDVTDFTSTILKDNALAYGAKYIDNVVTVGGARNIGVTFRYRTGNCALNVRGVEVIDADGNIVAGDYRVDKTGTNTTCNYTVKVAEAGTYTVRSYATFGASDRANDTNGDIVVSFTKATEEDFVHNITFAAEYATLHLGYQVAVPTYVEAYVVSEIADGYAKMTKVEGVIPAATPVILKNIGTEKTYTFSYTADEATAVGENLLKGSIANRYVTEEAYVLTKNGNNVCFGLAIKNQLSETAFLNNANKVYLPKPADANGISFYGFRFGGEDDETTGVEKVETVTENAVIFDLAGRRVSEITAPGIYIIDGKKVLVK